MSKKAFKSQASSSTAATGGFGGVAEGNTFAKGFGSSTFGGVSSTPLSYVYEPPDLSGLSEPHVGVAFKNVQKKDSTTKSKAIEELQAYVSALGVEKGGMEGAMLEAWIKVYPRTSIDSSRRVRQLAHILQGQIALSCGKRMAKHMPFVVPSWVAGLYDNDKSVVRAANESFNRVFTTEEKRKNVWRLYQTSILEYSRDVICKETTATLSDERTTSPGDASAKYSRVVGSAMMIVTNILENSSAEELDSNRTMMEELMNEEKLWKLATHADPYVRRAVYRLLSLALAKQKTSLNPSIISTHVITSGLHTSQTSSAFDYAKAINILSIQMPEVWTVHYSGSGKKSAHSRLCFFLKRGSQGGPPEFWTTISSLLSNLPPSIIISVAEDGSVDKDDGAGHVQSPILKALHEGINSKDESRLNQEKAWNTYLSTLELVQSSSPKLNQHGLLKGYVIPIIQQYVKPSLESVRWTISGPYQKSICLRACKLVLVGSSELFQQEWLALSEKIVEDLKTLLPEQSKDHKKSQDSLLAVSGRWYQLQKSLLESGNEDIVLPIVRRNAASEIKCAINILESRNGKPYGAAATLEVALQSIPDAILGDHAIRETTMSFATTVIPKLILSPSAEYLIRVLEALGGRMNITQAYEDCMRTLMNAAESPAKNSALRSFLSSGRLRDNEPLSATVMRSLQYALDNDDENSWDLVMAAIGNPVAPKDLMDHVLADMVEGLSINTRRPASLHGLELTSRQNEVLIREFALSNQGSNLLSALLHMAESDNEDISGRARNLNLLLEQTLRADGGNGRAAKSIVDFISQGIAKVEANPLPVDVLVSQAHKLLDQTSTDDLSVLVADLLPNLSTWTNALAPFMAKSPNPSLAITNAFGGALALIDTVDADFIPQLMPTDGEGYSPAFRVAYFVTRLMSTTKVAESVSDEHRTTTCKGLALILQLAGDNISISKSMPLWDSTVPDLENEVVGIVTEMQGLLASWLQAEPSSATPIPVVQTQLLNDSAGLSVASYYSARAYHALTTESVELHGSIRYEKDTDRLKAVRKSKDAFAAAAFLAAAHDSKDLERLCNELIADLTAHDFLTDIEEGLRKLALLDCILKKEEDYVTRVPQQRVVFFVKHAVQQLELVQPASVIGAQVMTVLAVVLPRVSEIYGSFWSELLDTIQTKTLQTEGDDTLFSVHASLRLLSLIRKPHMQEANDDILDSWNEKKGAIAAALLKLLKQLADSPDQSHQPRRIINDLLSRLLMDLSIAVEVEIEDLYPVLASESAALQTTAFELSHRHIPSVQEQISVDKALSKDFVAQLPQELLSLILTAPTVDDLAEINLERTMPSALRSYLLSWKLTFDHWQNASYKVQADYVTALQEGTYVQDLLSLALNVLVGTRTKPVDASKFKIETYTPNLEESPEKEAHWLFIHLYYLCLRYLPAVTKTWWRDTASRQLSITVESWTEKHFSPLIITSELATISDWAPSQATADQPITIKTSLPAREILASIPIDEQTMTIAIHLPKPYPLARAEVTSVHRVGVAEKKWNFWLINAQGVINFSSGGAGEGNAIIDGLMAWRKNVTATMKGQTECAICYSVVGADRQLPNKKCQTCKNTFHSACLFRWFKSSNSSSCPLCRNAFHYS